MADNTVINPGVGGDTLRTDDVGSSIKVPVSKIITGGDGVDGGFVGVTNPFPVLLCSGSDTVGTATNPLRTSGSVGLLVGGVAASLSNPIPVAPYEAAGALLSGSTVRTVFHAFLDASSGSANQIVAPQGANNRIALLSAQVITGNATAVRFVSTGSAGSVTNIAAINQCPSNGGFVLPHNPHGWCKTVANEGLNLVVFATSQVGVTITWAIFNNP